MAGRRGVVAVPHDGKRRELRGERVFLPALETMEPAALVCVFPEQGMVWRDAGKGQDAFVVRCAPSAGRCCFLSVDETLVLVRGGMLRSGKVMQLDENFELLPAEEFRKRREPLRYRVDVGYSYRKSFGEKLFLLRLGVYNLVGNPSEEDILNFYSVHWRSNFLPYGSVSFKF